MIPTLSVAERLSVTAVLLVLESPLLTMIVGLLGLVVSFTIKVMSSDAVDETLKIPMIKNKRSLNLASSVAIILAEQIRQINNG